jgi:hypothetical protein
MIRCEKRKLKDVYELKERLGKGNYGDVMLAVHKATGRRYAAKSIHRKEHWGKDEFVKRVAQV